jgi:predicted SprT family Zn-dependent metalloprotease
MKTTHAQARTPGPVTGMTNYLPPTSEVAFALDKAFDHFNRELFDGQLPHCLMLVHRKRNAHGYFWAEQIKRNSDGTTMHEIALNPHTMGRTPREVLATLAHEMAHLWDHEHGKPPKTGHGKTWAAKMDEIGLTPTATGQPGGARTGRKVTHMIVDGGPFDQAFQRLADAGVVLDISAIIPPLKEKKKDLSKVKHTCPSCNMNVWGKLGIRVECLDCNERMLPEDELE